MLKKSSKENEIFERYLQGSASEEEKLYIYHALNAFSEKTDQLNDETELADVAERVWARIQVQNKNKFLGRKVLFTRVASIAAACLVVFAIAWHFNRSLSDSPLPLTSTVFDDIAPGGVGGTLTLASGEEVDIDPSASGILIETSTMKVYKSQSGQITYEVKEDDNAGKTPEYNVLKTGSRQQIELVLPDKSTVFLNSESTLKYPTYFSSKGARRVDLTGEGYFEIAKDNLRPFIVLQGEQEVKVLGTKFNINSHAEHGVIRTTLMEGAIEINGQLMRPGQLALNRNGKVQIVQADTRSETAWIHQEFYFKNKKLGHAMQEIARWYGVEVVYRDTQAKDIPINAYFSRDKSLSTIMTSISEATNLRYRISGSKLLISTKQIN